MYDLIGKNKEKMEEKEMQERFKKLQAHAVTLLESVSAMDLTINDAFMVLKLATESLQNKGGSQKVSDLK